MFAKIVLFCRAIFIYLRYRRQIEQAISEFRVQKVNAQN